MFKIMLIMIACIGCLMALGCVGSAQKEEKGMETISAQEAKSIMDSGVSYVLLDVRTVEEYQQGHIKGAKLVPDFELEQRATKELPDKDALVLVYCRSGRRSLASAKMLAGMGYTNIKDIGGIMSWPYDVER